MPRVRVKRRAQGQYAICTLPPRAHVCGHASAKRGIAGSS
jgi:hypothetical protein